MTSRSTPTAKARLWVVPPRDEPTAQPRLPAPTLDDSQLLASVRAGDPDAAAALHDRLRPVVERAIRRILGRGDRDHEDLTQQAMIEVVTTVDRFRGDCPLDGWASTVAAHVVYNHIRRRTTERRIFESIRFEEDELPASTRSLARDASARSVLRRVLAHLDAIDEAKSWAYVLHDVCGYDLREVAEITGASVAAAQSRLVRGRRELLERLSADPELAPMLANRRGGQ
ncbi:MAG: polymerase, sigma-24 subunit, subfamily [Labilithrix sp.]|nr:polymerase, sigma-24 subunit, subfamily [Labilithrix sp.]